MHIYLYIHIRIYIYVRIYMCKIHLGWLAFDPHLPCITVKHLKMSGLISHGVVDREKKIQESPWTGERRFWILPQDTPGPHVSVPSDSAVEKSGDVSNDGVSEGPSTNSSNPSQYSGGPNTVEKLSQSMEYGPVRLRNWSKGPSNFLFRPVQTHPGDLQDVVQERVWNSFRIFFFQQVWDFFFGFLGWYHLPSVCNGLEIEFVILHGICHIWACSPSILHGIYYMWACSPSILYGICHILACSPSILHGDFLHVGMFTFHFVWYLPHFGMFTFHFAWDVLHVSMFTQIFYRCGSLGLNKKRVGGIEGGR